MKRYMVSVEVGIPSCDSIASSITLRSLSMPMRDHVSMCVMGLIISSSDCINLWVKIKYRIIAMGLEKAVSLAYRFSPLRGDDGQIQILVRLGIAVVVYFKPISSMPFLDYKSAYNINDKEEKKAGNKVSHK
jgi:hypothetical protein